jgi:hypothetical protein
MKELFALGSNEQLSTLFGNLLPRQVLAMKEKKNKTALTY